MRAALKSLVLDPTPSALPADPASFSMNARLTVGPADGPGEETFDITVCTPEWLANASNQAGGIYDARHHVIVTLEQFDQRALHGWFEARVDRVEGDDWGQIGERLARLGYWEFEDYGP